MKNIITDPLISVFIDMVESTPYMHLVKNHRYFIAILLGEKIEDKQQVNKQRNKKKTTFDTHPHQHSICT